jgi:tetratricopeptide (TPR) repeat protein
MSRPICVSTTRQKAFPRWPWLAMVLLLALTAPLARGERGGDLAEQLVAPQIVIPQDGSTSRSAAPPQSATPGMRRLPPVTPGRGSYPGVPVERMPTPAAAANAGPDRLPSGGSHTSQPWSVFLQRNAGAPQSPALHSTPSAPLENEFSSVRERRHGDNRGTSQDDVAFARQHGRRLPPILSRPGGVGPTGSPAPSKSDSRQLPGSDDGPMNLEPPQVTDGITQGQTAAPAPAVTSGVPVDGVPLVPGLEKDFAGSGPMQTGAPEPPLDVVATLPRASATALQEQVHRHVQSGFTLAGRRAYYSAKREFEQALRLIVEARDAQSSRSTHRQQLAEAIVALSEAEEFFVDDPQSGGRAQLNNVVVTHRTSVLKSMDLSQVTPMAAMQEYFAFAQHQLTEALGGQPSAAPALFGLGKTYQALSMQRDALEGLHGAKSLLMYQVAVRVDPTHHLAANELGVMLARYGQYEDAKRALLQCPEGRRPAEVWHNLAIVHQQLGEQAAADGARRQFALAVQAQRNGQQHPLAGGEVQDGVTWVDVSAAAADPEGSSAATQPDDNRQASRGRGFNWPWSR